MSTYARLRPVAFTARVFVCFCMFTVCPEHVANENVVKCRPRHLSTINFDGCEVKCDDALYGGRFCQDVSSVSLGPACPELGFQRPGALQVCFREGGAVSPEHSCADDGNLHEGPLSALPDVENEEAGKQGKNPIPTSFPGCEEGLLRFHSGMEPSETESFPGSEYNLQRFGFVPEGKRTGKDSKPSRPRELADLNTIHGFFRLRDDDCDGGNTQESQEIAQNPTFTSWYPEFSSS